MTTNLDHLADAVANRLRRTGHMEMLTSPVGFYSALMRTDAEGRILGVDYQVRIEKYAGRGSAWRKVVVPAGESLIVGNHVPRGSVE